MRRPIHLVHQNENVLNPYLAPSIRVGLIIGSAIVFLLVAAPCLYLIVWSIYGTDTVGVLRPLDEPTG